MIETRHAPCFRPSLDVHAEDGELVVHAELPGMCLEEITLRVDRGELILAGEHDEGDDGIAGHVRGSLAARLPLPFDTPDGRYRARFAGDVLEVRVPIP